MDVSPKGILYLLEKNGYEDCLSKVYHIRNNSEYVFEQESFVYIDYYDENFWLYPIVFVDNTDGDVRNVERGNVYKVNVE